MSTRLCRKEAERRRLRGMTLLDQGWSQVEVAYALDVSPAAVCQWVKARRRGGAAALKAKPPCGRPAKLTVKQRSRLEKLLLRGPRKHGWSTELWTLPRVAERIKKHFDVSYDPSGVWHVFKRMGWSCQKPERRARERDEHAVERWCKQDWPRIKKSRTKRAQHRFCR